jgi:hypothetical protein
LYARDGGGGANRTDNASAGAFLQSAGFGEELGRRGTEQFFLMRKKACDVQAGEKKLNGAAKTSFTKKCLTESVGSG